MIVLGMDPSLRGFGWVIHDTESPTEKARCLHRGTISTSPKELFISRYMRLRDSVSDIVEKHSPDNVAIEYPVFHELYSAGMYGLFLFVFEALYHKRQDVVFFSPTHAKAYVREFLGLPTGYGDPDKSDMITAARKATGGGGRWTHHEADAYIMALMGGRFWKYLAGDIRDTDLTPYESRMFTEVKTPTKGKMAGRVLKKGMIYREDDRFFLLSRLQRGHDREQGKDGEEEVR